MEGGLIRHAEVMGLLTRNRQRGSYLRLLLEMELGREPTDQEFFEAQEAMEEKRLEREAEIAAMPWHKRKHFIDDDDRIERVLVERYNVPKWLIHKLINYAADTTW